MTSSSDVVLSGEVVDKELDCNSRMAGRDLEVSHIPWSVYIVKRCAVVGTDYPKLPLPQRGVIHYANLSPNWGLELCRDHMGGITCEL